MKSIPENAKQEIINNLKFGKKLDSIMLLKNLGNTLNDASRIVEEIENQINNVLVEQDDYNVIKDVFSKYFEENKEFLIPEEIHSNYWKNDSVLFTTNDKVKGKIIYKVDKVEFKLKHKVWAPYMMNGVRTYDSNYWDNSPLEDVRNGEFIFPVDVNGRTLFEKIPMLVKNIKTLREKYKLEKERQLRELEHMIEDERIKKLNISQLSIINQLDKDGDGIVDLIDGESFNKLINKHQKFIINVDKTYIQKFVKISIYLKTKKSNTQNIFNSIKETKNENELNELINLLKNQIHTYDLLVFHSISMVTSLIESDLITFYEIYECFDQLGVFNSNWENEVSNKLTNIGDGIKELMYSIYEMENRIVQSIENLTYVTQDSFSELQGSIANQLSDINSGIQINNLLTGIQTYQMYRINQNTKRLN